MLGLEELESGFSLLVSVIAAGAGVVAVIVAVAVWVWEYRRACAAARFARDERQIAGIEAAGSIVVTFDATENDDGRKIPAWDLGVRVSNHGSTPIRKLVLFLEHSPSGLEGGASQGRRDLWPGQSVVMVITDQNPGSWAERSVESTWFLVFTDVRGNRWVKRSTGAVEPAGGAFLEEPLL